jgi:hypothetical protein
VPLSLTLFRWEDEPSVRVELETEGGEPVIKGGRVYDPAAIYRALGVEPCCER